MAFCKKDMRLRTYNIKEIKDFFSSSRGRDVLLFIIFVIISFVFWAILALNNFIQDNYRVKFKITGIPQDVTIISDYPHEFNVTVRNHGYVLLKYMIGDVPEIKAEFKNYLQGNDMLVISKQELADLLVSKFGNGTNILSFSPESLNVKYTSLPGKKVPVEIIGDYTSNFQYIVNGELESAPDSVIVYSDAMHLSAIDAVRTEKIVCHNLTDSFKIKTALQRVEDVKIVPDSVDVVIPVEPLVTKRSSIPVIIKNLPEGINMLIFPSSIQVSYLLPMSMYNARVDEKFEASVDYNNIRVGAKLPVKVETAPAFYRNIQLESDSVEYIIEHK